jgi:signal transduction histidine kinase
MLEYPVPSEHAAEQRFSLRLPKRKTVVGVVVLGAAYYGSARIGYHFEFAGPVAAIVWPPVGIGISFLYLGGLQLWPGVVMGDLLANDYHALPLGSALGQTAGNTLEVVVGALLIRKLVRRGSPLESVGGVGALAAAVGVATALSATVGTSSLLLGNVISASDLPTVWRTWWLGDACGAIVIVPFAIAWWRSPRPRPTRARALEAATLLVSAVGLTALAFATSQPIVYLVFPGLAWAALRFHQRGAPLVVLIVVGLAVWETTHYHGPFTYESVTRSVLSTQLFVFVAALSTLCLAAVVSERERVAERLRASRARLARASDTERRRLEQNLHDGAQQRLTALAFRLEEVAGAVLESPREARALAVKAGVELDEAIADLRELAQGIHPSTLRLGLAHAVKDLVARSPVPVEHGELPSEPLPDETVATAYYVVAEAVTNAQRHARADSIRVSAAVDGGVLRVEVRDDGVGGARETGTGLEGLRDRVEAAGGSFRVVSPPGGGTLVAAALPVGDG